MKKVPVYFVYVTTNLVNGKRYVGQHCTYDENDHYFGSNKDLEEDLRLYGEKNFKRQTIEYCDDIFNLAQRELFWIKEFNAVEDDNWYNLNYICSPNVWFFKKHTAASKKIMSEKKKGKNNS